VDNDSSDGTIEYLQPKFPFVHFIANRTNAGFAVANNQALAQAKGKYVLFLNPDTILPEDFFEQCVHFMEAHTNAGALGVRMIDGSGQFLKESKRGIPTPWVAFCKMTGLTGLFPASKIFARYYLGHLPEYETNPAEALAGACMLVKKEVLQQTGGFDERFFMYAEDIDLSWRIQQAGYINYYFPKVTIIHFKGESTRKDARYIKLFYEAMVQFVEKHFTGKWSGISVALLKAAIRLRAALVAAWKPREPASQHMGPRHNQGNAEGGGRNEEPASQHVVLHNNLYTAYTGYVLAGDEASINELPLAAGAKKQTIHAQSVVEEEGHMPRMEHLPPAHAQLPANEEEGHMPPMEHLPPVHAQLPANEEEGHMPRLQRPPAHVQSVVFCEGPSFSYKNLIAVMQQQVYKHKYIHGKGTASIVGSTSSNRQGQTFSW
jgi:Predicted glycosyltransferases